MVTEALVSSLNALLKIALSYGRPLPDDVMKIIDHTDNPARLSDLVALYVNLPIEELQAILETIAPLRAAQEGLHASDYRGAALAGKGGGSG